MESVIKQLVKIGHGMSAEVANDEPAVAKLLVELSSALDVQYERSNALEAKCAALASELKQSQIDAGCYKKGMEASNERLVQLAAENARYSMSAGQADQRMSESQAVRFVLGFQKDSDDVSPSDLVEKIQSLLIESEMLRSAHPQPLGPIMDSAIDAFNSAEMPETGMLNAFFILRGSILVETPATDAYMAEVRAQGVDMAIKAAMPEVASEFQRETFEQCVSATVRYPQSDLAGKVEMVAWLELFAAQLRQGGAE